jgi:hypothetical protein
MGANDRYDQYESLQQRKDRERITQALDIAKAMLAGGTTVQATTVTGLAFISVSIVDTITQVVEHMEPDETYSLKEVEERISHVLRRLD